MDVSLGLSQAVAAAAVMALSSRNAGSVYPLDSGRLLLSVTLLRKGGPPAEGSQPPSRELRLVERGETASQALAEEYHALLAPGAQGFPVLPVRLLPGRRGRIRQASRSLARGFETALVRPAQALAVSGLLTFGLAALTAFLQDGRTGVPLAGDVGSSLQPTGRFEQVLLADISAPHPHAFRRGWITRWNTHNNSITVHSNASGTHQNVPRTHQNQGGATHSNTPGTHSNSWTGHTNTNPTTHTNTTYVPHTNTDTRPNP
ncbi:MAG: hypothetical protein ACOX9B_04495 [Candidatus Xenobium sp.]